MKPFLTMIHNFSLSPRIRGFIPDFATWVLLIAFITGLTATAQAATGGTVLWQLRDSKVGIQMPTVPTGSAVDSNGTIYMVGYQKLIGGTSGEDYYLIRIKPSGEVDTAWGTKSYNEANLDDRATGVAVDSADNVIVTGNITMADGGKHIHTIKYSGATGNVLWEHTYEPTGPAHTSDQAAALAVQGDYVYIAGVARVSGSTNDDILILRYDNTFSDGGSHPPLAAIVYDRAGKQDVADHISAAAGGVALVGRTWNGAEFDMLTLKYDLGLADATKKVWQHPSPGGNAAGNNGSWGRFVKVDPDGNVIASGFDISSGSDKDIYTAKYCDNPAPATCNGVAQGSQVWERRYQGSFPDDVKALTIDANKDVYLTGTASRISSDTDFYTAKYSGATGTLLWEALTNAGSTVDVPTALVVDDAGEVYVSGYAKLNGVDAVQTMKYRKDAPSGRLLWQKTFKNPDNPAGNADMLDIRSTGIGLSSGGVVVSGWANKLSAPPSDSGTATAGSGTTLQDNSKTWTPSQYPNYYLKITSAGANNGQVRLITGNTSNTLTVSPVFPAAISPGDSYEIDSVDTDYYALKYEKGTLDRPTDLTATTLSNSSIQLSWSDNSSTETGFKLERCKGKGCDFSILDAVITLGADVTSYEDNNANNTASGTPKLDPDSYYYYRVKAYTTAPAEESETSNSARGLTVFLNYPAPLAGNIFTYDGTDHQEDTSPAVAVGPDNNPVITGRSFIAGDGFDYYTVKLDRTKLSLPAGILWSAKYDGGQYDNDEATCLAVDKNNKVIVAGDSILPPLGGGENMNVMMTVQYLNPPAVDGLNNPTHSWSDQYNGPGKLDDHATTMATDSSGNFVVVGHGKKDAGNRQYVYVVKYNADKTRAWAGELFDAGVNGRPAGRSRFRSGRQHLRQRPAPQRHRFRLFHPEVLRQHRLTELQRQNPGADHLAGYP